MTREQQPSQPLVKSRTPEFQTREEEAEFWDTHDFTDFLDESWPVEVRIGQGLGERLTVRLAQADRAELARRARELGSDPETLAGAWIAERLRGERTAAAS